MEISAYQIAQRFIGTKEIPGSKANAQVLAMLKLDGDWPEDDAVPWCSAFVNYVCWLLRLPRSKSLRARSWLRVGTSIPLDQARPGSDVVVIKRGEEPQPGADNIEAPGHVGFFSGREGDRIWLLGGNQGDAVSLSSFPVADVLGVRRLEP